jgi:hypothetical protein
MLTEGKNEKGSSMAANDFPYISSGFEIAG